jgi:hypothetical protein
MTDDFERVAKEARLLGKATLWPSIDDKPEVFGSGAFFASATEVLLESTRDERELGGACYCVERDGKLVLVGLSKRSRGDAKTVSIDPDWGAILWHTHPGLSFSVAAFSMGDLEGASDTGRPLLVIGYRFGSPDSTGLTQAVAMGLGMHDEILERLLRVGVAARVCWPDGEVRAVRRYLGAGVQEVVDDASFQIDRAVGVAARSLRHAPRLARLNTTLADGLVSLRKRVTRRRDKKR